VRNWFPRLLFTLAFVCAVVPAYFLANPPLLNSAHPSVRAVAAVQREVTGEWMRQSEVLGTAVGLDGSGKTTLAVYVDRDAPRAAQVVRGLPEQVRGVAVEVRLTDKFRALRKRHKKGRGGGPVGISHKTAQTLPIQLGTSGGSGEDKVGRFCCGGTLGALVQIGGVQYVLSNWHVLEEDLVPGKNYTVASTGDAVVQPGLDDVNCDPGAASIVATLEKRDSLPASNVDCAIGKVNPGMVQPDGAILEIGPISSQTLPAVVGQAVKKSGRTTGLTRSYISGLNATINIAYDNECGGSRAFVKTFTGQIIVAGGTTFLDDGDSGSLLVENVETNPRAIGLLYAGSTTDSIANPIDEVLSFLGATMVGN
jgi:hypothetical protein